MHTDPAIQTKVAPRDWLRPRAIALAGAAISGAAVATFSGDWACSAISAAFFAAVICGGIAYAVRRMQLRKRGRALVALGAMVVAVAVVQVVWIRTSLTRNSFRTAFGTVPPATARDIHVARHYVGGPGDTVTLLRFRAAPDQVAALVAALPPSSDTWELEETRAGRMSARELWMKCFDYASRQANQWWPADGPVLSDPQMYRRLPSPDDMPPIGRTILWDRSTGEVFVMITVG